MLLYISIGLGAVLVSVFLVALARSLRNLGALHGTTVPGTKATRKSRKTAGRSRKRRPLVSDPFGVSKVFPGLNSSSDAARLRRAERKEGSIEKPWGW